MITWRRAGLALVFVWFLLGGIGHFIWPDTYTAVTPAWVPFPRDVVFLTGLCDIAGAFGVLWPRTRRLAGYALMLYCVCVTPVHIEMLQHAERYAHVGLPALWARLLFQPVLIWIIWRVAVAAPRQQS